VLAPGDRENRHVARAVPESIIYRIHLWRHAISQDGRVLNDRGRKDANTDADQVYADRSLSLVVAAANRAAAYVTPDAC